MRPLHLAIYLLSSNLPQSQSTLCFITEVMVNQDVSPEGSSLLIKNLEYMTKIGRNLTAKEWLRTRQDNLATLANIALRRTLMVNLYLLPWPVIQDSL